MKLSYIYVVTSVEIFHRLSRTANGSVLIYSKYHRPMLTHSPTELYPCPLGDFHLTKRGISNYRRPIAGMSLSEHVMTSQRRWSVCAGGVNSCVAVCR